MDEYGLHFAYVSAQHNAVLGNKSIKHIEVVKIQFQPIILAA